MIKPVLATIAVLAGCLMEYASNRGLKALAGTATAVALVAAALLYMVGSG
jgi:hypothetical protein